MDALTSKEKITADQVRDAVIASGKTWIPHHRCGGCSATVGYSVVGEDLFFEADCDCSSYASPPQPREWSDPADWINMQSNEEARRDIAARFGVDVAESNKPEEPERPR